MQDWELRGHGNFEWNTDLIEKKLESYTRQVAQDLYSGEAQNEPREAQHKHNTAYLYTKHVEGLRTQSLARKRDVKILSSNI